MSENESSQNGVDTDEVRIHEIKVAGADEGKAPTAKDLHKIAKLNFGAPDMGEPQEEKEEEKQPA